MNFLNHFIQYEEETLVNIASAGSLEAFNQMVLIHQDLGFHHADALLADPALAEDATQESFIRAFRGHEGISRRVVPRLAVEARDQFRLTNKGRTNRMGMC